MRIAIIRYEVRGLDNPPVRMAHSNEGFGSLEGQVARVYFWLIPQFKPPGAKRFPGIDWRARCLDRQKCCNALAQTVIGEGSSQCWQHRQAKSFAKFSERSDYRRVLRTNQQNRTVKLLCGERL